MYYGYYSQHLPQHMYYHPSYMMVKFIYYIHRITLIREMIIIIIITISQQLQSHLEKVAYENKIAHCKLVKINDILVDLNFLMKVKIMGLLLLILIKVIFLYIVMIYKKLELVNNELDHINKVKELLDFLLKLCRILGNIDKAVKRLI